MIIDHDMIAQADGAALLRLTRSLTIGDLREWHGRTVYALASRLGVRTRGRSPTEVMLSILAPGRQVAA